MNATTTITILTSDGKLTVEATVISGLAYHPRLKIDGTPFTDEWVVSHVASGRSAFPGFNTSVPTPEQCQMFIAEVQDLVDWTLSAEELWQRHGEFMKPAPDIAKAIRQAYSRALIFEKSAKTRFSTTQP